MQEKFYATIRDLVDKIEKTQSATIHELAKKLAKILADGGILYTFGTGHSHMMAEEPMARAGGLIQVKGIMEPELMDLHRNKSTHIERLPGYAELVFNLHGIRQKDALLIISNSGRNPAPVEMALKAKKEGILTIALTNIAHSNSVPSRDPSGKRLFEICDYVLDNCGIPGDAALAVEGRPYRVSPTSTIAGAVILQALTAEIVGAMLEIGCEPPVLGSGNMDGNDDRNRRTRDNLFAAYPELPFLLS